ncbi:short chain dehydrogenase reductase [Fusarium albosuccineum]|uniref:Short chain dehydrogenase reductase n=1 Tax=Fusarium albosuccineum TaxID=1237068 RepID=A0A8H4PIF3_9HYPO|nr:short chain dehydrogenase reductase [Fusarium albosuccineum]
MFSRLLLNLSQIWPPAPRFTEKNVPDQSGKVFIVTGASAGVGKELAQILFSLNAKVYLASRTESKVNEAIEYIRSTAPNSTGSLHFLPINLEDLNSVKQAAATFLENESRLDGLWNNAGVMLPPEGSKTKQGYELQLGVNCLASFLFMRLLTSLMVQTARIEQPGAVRVLWVGSSAVELFSPPGGVDLANLDYKRDVTNSDKYAVSKGGMVLLSQEYARLHKEDGIISVAMNPGNLKTELRRHLPGYLAMIFGWLSWDPRYGAYTELFAGFSPDITLENSGCWVIPWGRISPVRQDIQDAATNGIGERFWAWCEGETREYLFRNIMADPPFTSDRATLARAKTEDIPAIKSIVNSAYTKYIERIGKPPAPMLADYDELLQSHDVFVLRELDSDVVVGSIMLSQASDSIKINNLVVDVTAQGRGYGGVLMRYAEDFAKAKGRPALTLFTNIKMYENLSLYPKMGFDETERRTEDGYERVYFRKDL